MRALDFPKMFCLAALFCFSAAIASHAQTYTKLANFVGSNGTAPEGPLVQGTNGNLYGVTNQGGTASNCSFSEGCGTIFAVTPGGKVTTLYSFCSLASCADGLSPRSGLALATNGNFYGMTPASTVNGGTIFEITPAGKFTLLYTFCSTGTCADGSGPLGTLMQAANGNLYGVTSSGGTGTGCAEGCGTIFQITLRARTACFTPFARPRSARMMAENRARA